MPHVPPVELLHRVTLILQKATERHNYRLTDSMDGASSGLTEASLMASGGEAELGRGPGRKQPGLHGARGSPSGRCGEDERALQGPQTLSAGVLSLREGQPYWKLSTDPRSEPAHPSTGVGHAGRAGGWGINLVWLLKMVERQTWLGSPQVVSQPLLLKPRSSLGQGLRAQRGLQGGRRAGPRQQTGPREFGSTSARPQSVELKQYLNEVIATSKLNNS